jgi:type IV secretion system protein VirB9
VTAWTARLGLPLLLAACAAPQAVPEPPAPPEPPRRLYTLDDLHPPETRVEAPPEPRRKPGARPSRAESRRQVGTANEAGLELPELACFRGKTCEYWYVAERQYLVYMAAGNQTLVCLKPGEVTLDVVAPGAQVWIPHAVFAYGSGGARTECVAFMPRRAGLDHQVSIFTDARKYDLRIETWTKTRHVEVRWRYPEDVLAALNRGGEPVNPGAGPIRDRVTGLDARSRWCGYELAGATPPWRPVPTADGQPPVCDDGEVTVINFAPGTLGGQGAPVVWRIEADGTRMPVQYGRLNATYRVAGVHEHLLLGLGAAEVHVTRRAP